MALTERLEIPDFVPDNIESPPIEDIHDGLTSFAAWARHEGPHWSSSSHAPTEQEAPIAEVIVEDIGQIACSIVRFDR